MVWVTTTTTFQYTAFWWSIDVDTGVAKQRGQFSDIGNPEMGFERGNAVSGETDATFFMSYDEGDPSCWPYCPANPQIWQVNSNTGEQRETVLLPPAWVGVSHDSAISTFGGTFYASNRAGDLMAIDPSKGGNATILWKGRCSCTGSCLSKPDFFDDPYHTFFSPIIVVSTEDTKKGVIITGTGNQLCSLDLASGKLLWQYQIPTYIFQQPAVSPFGDIFVSTLTLHHGSHLLAV